MEAKTKSIGTATMTEDGTIILDLRAEGEKGEVGIGRISYHPSHEKYDYILKHLGGLKPGEKKPVPPFDDKKNK